MGRKFYESTLPELVRQLGRVADGLERLNKDLEAQATKPPTAPEGAGETTQDR
jgi:hypothetical protein